VKKRVWWISIAGVMLAAQSCAIHTQPVLLVKHLQIDSAFTDFLTEYREILPTERVLCLYGAVRNDTAWINFLKPATMRERSQYRAVYDDCPKSPIPFAMFLGTWHNHKVDGRTDDLCRFSDTDDKSFMEDPKNLIELLSCRGKLMARSKFK
jgi:hypothetical protein